MFGFLLGGLAVAWGALAAFVDQPGVAGARAERWCTALLVTSGAVTVAGGVAAFAGPW